MDKEKLVSIVKGLLEFFDKDVKIEIEPEKNTKNDGNPDGWLVKVESVESGHLIGFHGETLISLQYVLRVMVTKAMGEYVPITLDIDKYKEKKIDELKELALLMAENVKSSGYPQEMKPMSSYDRRIVHSVLADFEGVKTSSVGEEGVRRVKVEKAD